MELKTNTFTTYSLTPEEERLGHVLTELNVAVLQNLLADAAENKVNYPYDPTEPLKYAQAVAEYEGKIAILRWLIDRAKWANTKRAMEETALAMAQLNIPSAR